MESFPSTPVHPEFTSAPLKANHCQLVMFPSRISHAYRSKCEIYILILPHPHSTTFYTKVSIVYTLFGIFFFIWHSDRWNMVFICSFNLAFSKVRPWSFFQGKGHSYFFFYDFSGYIFAYFFYRTEILIDSLELFIYESD